MAELSQKPKVMIVDDNMANLKVGKVALAGSYDVFTAPGADKMLGYLQKSTVDLILLDVDMPDIDGYDAIKLLKANPFTADIPVIFLTAKSDSESEITGLDLGAVDYISKPFNPALLRRRVDLHLTISSQQRLLEEQSEIISRQNVTLRMDVEVKGEKVGKLQHAILATVAELVENRDHNTGGHVVRTQLYLQALTGALIESGLYAGEVGKWDLDLLFKSSQLHDVGKIYIPDAILNKPGRLTPDEFDIMKTHTTLGGVVIDRIAAKMPDDDLLVYAKIFALTHQEKWDGGGYPRSLRGEEIPLQGRLMAICDVYDALVSARPYKTPMSHEQAVRIILEGRGSHFEPALVDLFEGISDEFEKIRQDND